MKYYTTLLILFLASLAVAQSDTGTGAFEAIYPVNAYESINLGNLNVLLHAPLRAKQGPIPLSFQITSNVQDYVIANEYSTTTTLGPSFAQGYWHGQYAHSDSSQLCANNQNTTVFHITAVIDNSGTSHSINAFWDTKGCKYGAVDAFTTDNSGMELVIPQGSGSVIPNTTLYTRDGVGVNYPTGAGNAGTVTDPHGNSITLPGTFGTPTYNDELTSTPVLSYVYQSGIPGGFAGHVTPVNYTDGTGTTRATTVTSTQLTMLPAFSCSGITNISTNIYPLTKVAFADGSSVNFGYEQNGPNYTGRLKTVTIPQGGQFAHAYSGGTNNDGLWCESARISNATMTITAGSGTWTFARAITSGTYPNRTITTTLTKPDGSVVVYTFIGDNSPILVSKVNKDTDGSTLLSIIDYCYNSTISNCNSVIPSQNPSVVRAYHYVAGVANPSEVDTNYDTYGNVTEVDNYDFGPTLVSKEVRTIGNYNGTNCVAMGNHISSAVCVIYEEDAGGAVLAETLFQRNSVGDLLDKYTVTSVSPWKYLTDAATYNANGTIATHTSADGVQTTFGNSQCNGFLPDHATTAIGTVSMTWDCNGAVPLTTTDLNGLVTTTTYGDPLYRETQVSDNGGQAPVNRVYTSPTQSSTHMVFNGGAAIVDSTTTLNSLGQVISSQRRTTPTGTQYDTRSFGYDTTGHATSISTACTTTIGATCPTNASSDTFDGLNRVKTHKILTSTNGVFTYTYPSGDVNISLTPAPTGENAKSIQIEYNGLGQKVSTCRVTSTLSGRGSCGQRSPATGYLTKLTLDPLGRATQVSENAQTGGTPVNSTFAYDAASRVTSNTAPESGTATAHYDVATTNCPQFFLAGHLTSSTDAAGNENCIWYDNLGRPVSTHTAAGPNSGVTPVKKFVYDENSTSGVHLTGRIGDAFTCAPSTNGGQGTCTFANTAAHITDEQFSYDIYGRKADVFELTPATNGSYVHTASGYWDNGTPSSLQNIPGVANFSFGVDPEGRPYSASSGGSGIVAWVSYDSASNPLTTSYTNGDFDGYQWDAVTGNMTQYQFKIGTAQTANTGVLTWNPNGTLKTLAIADNINSGDTQTCNTAHDDLVRITSYNCGAIFNETYSRDYNGNLTKSGSIAFNPGYVLATNRYASGSGYTYDTNGNILHDATLNLNYTWDSNSNLITANGLTHTYDAFGREVSRSDGYTIIYSPVGYLGVAQNGTSALDVSVPLPGGGIFATGSYLTAGGNSNQQIRHMDFTGSAKTTSNWAARTAAFTFAFGPTGEQYYSSYSPECNVHPMWAGAQQSAACGMMDFGDGSERVTVNTGRSITPPYVQ
jgi:YD repeat-containing protein